MANFEAAVLADKLLKRATRDLMWTSLKTADGKETGYGLGWGIMDRFGLHVLAHTGGQQGTSTALAVVPARNAGVVVLCNLDSVGVEQLAMDILRIALDVPENRP
jgi:CubicO group peptidase (beta-lactamase class C family)